MGVEINHYTNKMFIIRCLLPSTNLPFDEYKRTLPDVFDAFDELIEVGPVIVCGDFNTGIKYKYNSQKSKLFKENPHQKNYCSIFADNNYTFQTKDKQFKSIIDYHMMFLTTSHPLLCEIDLASVFFFV